MEPAPSIRDIWSEDEANQWHKRWATLTGIYAALAFLLPISTFWGLGEDGPQWNFFWDLPWKGGAQTLTFLTPIVILVVLWRTCRWKAKARGVALLVLSAGSVFVAMGTSRQFEAVLIVAITLASFVAVCWGAAAAHSAYRFGVVARFRVPMIVAGLIVLLLSGLNWGLTGARNARPWHVSMLFIAFYGGCLFLAGATRRQGLLRTTRWLGRVTIFTLPIYPLLVVPTLDESDAAWTGMLLIVVTYLKIAFWLLSYVLVLSLGIANLGDAAARKTQTQRYTAEVFG